MILGYGLNDNGTMRTILRRRVAHTEAGQMRNMLVLLGFPANRIIVEDRANSTVRNAAFSVNVAQFARDAISPFVNVS